ncbi:MAG: xanthine dehydrogenase family protein molybdopterin-binding subunit [candidate division KSB1 bacterium]|nr:xanthine dehydrogenase family protein molybdopterin-binding subunit [candidate division KSB1 bacterium]MDZ7366851.1 xanthine dehydrogenase family protein molybdopterin-binding subunit [candidate division KSB1 bacterium]MDZ7405142.1 xanthine dehydrogenase family protein molybdopterin-binding subunit [candidate division KSB1 bacterium]
MIVGQNIARREGWKKVTGSAQYVDDLHVSNMLYGKTIRSTIAHGAIREIKFDPAFDWKRVTIADYRDIPGKNVVALIEYDQPLLAESRIRHQEEPILLLAAEDRELLEEAAKHIEILYDESPAVLTVEEALAGKQLVYGENNVFKDILISKGDLEQGFAAADFIVEAIYRTGHQEHVYIEPQGVIAIPESDGGIKLIGSLQCPYYVHKALKTIFDLPDDKVRVVQSVTGGGFGGKEEYPSLIAGHAAVLARKVGRPVKMIYNRGEDMAATTKRHPSVVHHKTGVTKDGKLVAAEIDLVLDGGAYCTLSPVVVSRASIHALGPYNCPNTRIRARSVATNTPPNGAFRGFGAPQVCFAHEMQMEKIAKTIGIDSLELRRRNMLKLGDTTVTGQTLKYSVGSEEVLQAAVEASNFLVKQESYKQQSTSDFGPRTSGKKHGIGLSLFFHGAGFTGSGEMLMKAKAGVELLPGGRVRILTASTEIGQGTNTIFPQIVAEELGLDLDDVEMAEPNTAKVPDSGPTVASRTCMVVGRVIQQAAQDLRQQLEEFVAAQLSRQSVALRHKEFFANDQRLMSLAEAAQMYSREKGALQVFRHYESPPGHTWDDKRYLGDAYPVYGWACDVVEVEVDTTTYEVFVKKVVSAADVGKAINPVLVKGQIEGGTLQALGYGMMEEVIMQNGKMANDRLTNYMLPTCMDAPDMEVILIEKPYPHGPFGAKGVGELPMDGAAPALAAAICNALGIEISELPFTPERLLQAVASFP